MFMMIRRQVLVVLAALIFFVGLFSSMTAAATGPMIVYPPDRALLSGDGSLELLGFLPGGSAGSVTITGSQGSNSLQVAAGAFTAKLKLAPGENSLVLLDRKVIVFVSEGVPASAPKGFSLPDTHAVDNGCEECHSFSDGAIQLLEKLPALCLRCHDDVLMGKNGKSFVVQHPPAEEGDCLSCHAFHKLAIKRLPADAKREICFGCHDPFPVAKEGKQLFSHKPVEGGECAACHLVHGSDNKKLLAAPGLALCLKCHRDPSLAPDGQDWSTAHPALDEGCASCHLPHVGPVAGLLKKEQAALCFDCHDPFLPPAAKGGSFHTPVAKGTCARCHAPHGSANKKLLLAAPGRELCLTCHKDPALDPGGTAWEVPHPALDDGCPSCHRPHVAETPRLLVKPQGTLCAECHEDKNLNGDGANWSAPHKPVADGTCASCHGVHGGPEKALLRKSTYEICDTCHTEVHERHRSTELDPATGQPLSAGAQLPPGFPVRKKDGKLACSGCHQAHGSDNNLLLNQDETSFCLPCHPM